MKINPIAQNNYQPKFRGIIEQPKEHQKVWDECLASIIENGHKEDFIDLCKQFKELPLDRKYHIEKGNCFENKPTIELYDTVAYKNQESGSLIMSKLSKNNDGNMGKTLINLMKQTIKDSRWILFKTDSLEKDRLSILKKHDLNKLNKFKAELDDVFEK